MPDDTQRPDSPEQGRRFKLTRKVKTDPKPPQVETDAEKAMRELEEGDDADAGYPEMRRELNRGCGGCVNVMVLLFVIMIASIITTCAIRK